MSRVAPPVAKSARYPGWDEGQHLAVTRLADSISLQARHPVQNAGEDDRMYRDVAVAEDRVGPSLDRRPHPATWVVLVTHEAIGQLVADQRLREIVQVRQQHLIGRRPRLDGLTRGVEQFHDARAGGERMNPPARVARTNQAFSRQKLIGDRNPERGRDRDAGLVGEHLGLTDEEYHWEPVPGMWGIRPRGTSTA